MPRAHCCRYKQNLSAHLGKCLIDQSREMSVPTTAFIQNVDTFMRGTLGIKQSVYVPVRMATRTRNNMAANKRRCVQVRNQLAVWGQK